MDKKKILWVSDLVAPTGFARVSHSILKFISDKYDITGVGVNYHGDPHNYKIPIYPASLSMTGSVFGERRVADILNSVKFDLLFVLNDSWVIGNLLAVLKKDVNEGMMPKIVTYFPVDSDFHDADWYKEFDIVTKAVTYTEFGQRVVKDCAPELEVDIIPHGVDADVFFPRANRWEAKKHLFGEAMDSTDPKESFIVLNANRNQPRKKLDITMEGFALFAKGKPDGVRLYMHCGIVDASVNLVKLSLRYRIDNRLIVTSTNKGIQRVSESRLNDIYNACDVGINTSMGEGWGLTNIEHAVTGAVQIVPDHSACTQLFSDVGILLPAKTPVTFDNSMTVGRMTTPQDVAASLDYLYNNRDKMDELAEKGRKKFSSAKYSWMEIAYTWETLFEEVLSESSTLAD